MFVLFLSLFLHYNAPPFRQTGFCRYLVTFIAPIFKFSSVERLTRVGLVVNQMVGPGRLATRVRVKGKFLAPFAVIPPGLQINQGSCKEALGR